MPNIAKWKQITENEFRDIVMSSHSIMEVQKKLGYATKSSGGIYDSIRQGIEFYNIDTSHFKGQGWRKGDYNLDWMKQNVQYYSKYAPSLINLRGRECEKCNLSEWMDSPIPLEVHHINGDKTNNEGANLILLCPNCHALTDNYRGRKKKQSSQ